MVEQGVAASTCTTDPQESLLSMMTKLAITGPISLGWRWITGTDEDEELAENQPTESMRAAITVTLLIDVL